MEIVVIIMGFIAGFLLLMAVSAFIDGEVAIGFVILLTGAAFAAIGWFTNQALVSRNLPPVPEGGVVTSITQTLDKGEVIYKVTLSGGGGSNTYTCVDRTVKCADLKLGVTVSGEKWASNGWSWYFGPQATAAR